MYSDFEKDYCKWKLVFLSHYYIYVKTGTIIINVYHYQDFNLNEIWTFMRNKKNPPTIP